MFHEISTATIYKSQFQWQILLLHFASSWDGKGWIEGDDPWHTIIFGMVLFRVMFTGRRIKTNKLDKEIAIIFHLVDFISTFCGDNGKEKANRKKLSQ